MQYHFVVRYDSEDDSFEMDYDSQEAFFSNAPIYDPIKDEWLELEPKHWADEETDYVRSSDAIYFAINHLKLKTK